jgi:hypothetical protein
MHSGRGFIFDSSPGRRWCRAGNGGLGVGAVDRFFMGSMAALRRKKWSRDCYILAHVVEHSTPRNFRVAPHGGAQRVVAGRASRR